MRYEGRVQSHPVKYMKVVGAPGRYRSHTILNLMFERLIKTWQTQQADVPELIKYVKPNDARRL